MSLNMEWLGTVNLNWSLLDLECLALYSHGRIRRLFMLGTLENFLHLSFQHFEKFEAELEGGLNQAAWPMLL